MTAGCTQQDTLTLERQMATGLAKPLKREVVMVKLLAPATILAAICGF